MYSSHQHHVHQWMLCPQCDLLTQLPNLRLGNKACCPRCQSTLQSDCIELQKRPAAYALAALFMLLLANLFPFINVHIAGLSNEITLSQIPQVMISDGYSSLAIFFLLFVQGGPAVCMVLILLLVTRFSLPQPLKLRLARLLFQLKTWGMAEIFLASVLVSFVKLIAYGHVGIGTSFFPWCLFCLLQLRAFQCIERRAFWENISPLPLVEAKPVLGISGLRQGLRSCHCCTAVLRVDTRICPRCSVIGHARRRDSLQWTLALLITSVLLYIPANIMPIMITEAFGNKTTSTIIAGVVLLWSDGSWPIALVIFIASIIVPSFKMIAIAWLCWDVHGLNCNPLNSAKMYKIYEMIEFIGRWSMIDVFVIAVLSALVRMGPLMSIYPAIGALLFAMVVILTMFAVMMFDPRLTWD